jgi:hypothetical protein
MRYRPVAKPRPSLENTTQREEDIKIASRNRISVDDFQNHRGSQSDWLKLYLKVIIGQSVFSYAVHALDYHAVFLLNMIILCFVTSVF